MKKITPAVFIIAFLFASSSCVTKRQHSSWQNFPPVPFFYLYQIDKVSVIIDHVKEENITRQLSMIAETYLASKQNYKITNAQTILLDINVEQRSFMQNMEMYNSIFISCTAHDGEGIMYAKENEYISGRQTFISAAEQNIIITRVLDRMISNQQKRYKEIQKNPGKTK